jgi:competence protein ComEA
MIKDSLHIRINSFLRRAGLSNVSKPVLVCIAIFLIAAIVAALIHFWPSQSAETENQDFQIESSNATSVESASKILVDIEGCVKNPGLYEFDVDARVGHAIEIAGGFTKYAARDSINLAEKLTDGMQLYVLSKKEQKSQNASGSASSSSSGASSSSSNSSNQEKINLNTATAQDLQNLSGIGETLSQRIVDYREKNGNFSNIEDLKKVSGIGDTRFESLKDYICV